MHPQSPALTIDRTVLKESDDLVILGVTFDSKILLRSIFARFDEKVLNGWVSWGSPGKYSMIDCFLGEAISTRFRVLYFFSADKHLKLLDHVVSGASFLTGGVFEWDLAHCQYLTILHMLYKIRCNSMHPLHVALYMLVRVTCGAGLHIGTLTRLLAAEPRSIAGPFSQYLCGTILVTPNSMVWDWRVSRAGSMPFYWSSRSLHFCLLFSFSLLSFYGLVWLGWGIRTD